MSQADQQSDEITDLRSPLRPRSPGWITASVWAAFVIALLALAVHFFGFTGN